MNLISALDEIMDMPKIIENATVYSQPLDHDNHCFGTRYYGMDADLVMKRAKRAMEEIDLYRSPSHSRPYEWHGYHAVDVNWYSLD